jgi:putative PIN family toxin of toxin-antitoxin system
MIRVVFDTNVLFSAVLKHVGVPAEILNLVTIGVLTPCVSDAVLAEYKDVLTRPVLRPHAARAREVLDLFAWSALRVSPTRSLALCSDPDDDRLLECADAADADYLVTGNLRHFPKGYPKLVILSPRALLQALTQ